MPNDRGRPWLSRFLAFDVASDIFEPAWHDLRVSHLLRRQRAHRSAARLGLALRHIAAVGLLFLDCWRMRSALHVDHRPKERFTMLMYHLRHASRLLLRDRGFTSAAILTLALGVGANVSVFAVLEAVLLRPLPYPDASRLVVLEHRDQRTGITKDYIAIGDYIDLVARQHAFRAIGGYGTRQATVFNVGEPFRVSALVSTSGVFGALGVSPPLGRALEPDDSRPGAARVAVLGYQMWQQRFGSDPQIVGRRIRIDSDDYQIVGVAPQGLRFPPDSPTDIVLPLSVPLEAPTARRADWTFAIARLNPNVSLDTATANLATISTQLAQEYPRENQSSQYFAVPLREALVGDSRTALVLLFAGVGVLLLIACANVANLLLARSLARRREMAVRLALGADRRQLGAQLLAESLLLALTAGMAAVLMARWGAAALVSLVPRAVVVPGLSDVRVNGAVLGFTLGLSVATALVFGLVSVLTVRSANGIGALVTNRATMERPARRAATALVISEAAFAFVLVIAAGLVLRSFWRLASIDPGFNVNGVLTVTTAVPADRYRDPGARQAFYARAFGSLRALPDVQAVGVAQVTPLTGNNWTVAFERADHPVSAGQRPPEVGWQAASGGYFAALQIPLLAGRLFNDRDRPGGPPVVIVSRAIEQRFFSGESVVGRKVKVGDTTAEIIGVVGNIRRAALTDEPRADLYFPAEQYPATSVTWFVRGSADPWRVLDQLRTSLHAIEPNVVLLEPRTMAEVAAQARQLVRFALWLFGLFAVIALALAAVGIYGVMSYVMRQRAREMGIRLALGATRADIVRLVMSQGAAIAVAGLVVGLAISAATVRSLGALLYGVPAWDPPTLLIAAMALVATVLAACYMPARRAARIGPSGTLAEP